MILWHWNKNMNKTENFKIKATKIHAGIYNYDKVVYTNVDTKVEIICPRHGSFFQTPRSHIYKKTGCNACAVDRSKIVNTKPVKQFIEEATVIHNSKYDYSLVEYKNANTPVTIICPVHGKFTQQPMVHIRGHGCKKCAVRLSQQDFISRANQTHNTRYNYTEVIYNTGKSKINIICPTHGKFSQIAESHLQGIGCPLCAFERRNFSSQAEKDIAAFINSLGFKTITNTHSIIPPKEIDIFVPERNIAIEFNGIFWHSELGNKDKSYHINKTIECQQQNVRLIHIFESEWITNQKLVLSRVKNLLGVSKQIYARQCHIDFVTTKNAKLFLNENHIQGFVPAKVYIGLYFNSKLVALMTFGKPRYNKTMDWELLRYCNIADYTIVGGASKLYKWFIVKYNPLSVISYSDKRWNTGKLYQILNFQHSHTSAPNYWYFLKNDTTKLISRNKFQKHKLKHQLQQFDPHITEWENMQNNNFNRIWDCGNDVWIWKNTF